MGYLIKKIGGFFLTLLLVSFITFLVFQVLPGNPAYIVLGIDADPLQVAAFNEEMGYNLPAPLRYMNWIGGALQGDLGTSIRYGQPVATIIAEALGVTASVAMLTVVLTVGVGVPLGLFVAERSGKRGGTALAMLSQLGISIPAFCMAFFLRNLLAVKLGLLPAIGFVSFSQSPVLYFQSLLLPALSMAFGLTAVVVRYIRVSVSAEKRQDYVRTAYSKGLGKRQVLFGHILRNALIPVVTIMGMLVTDILGGSIIIENIFSLPGIGKLLAVSIASRDLPLLQGLVLYLAAIVVVCGLLVDVVYAVIDPRMKLGGEKIS